MRESTPKPIHLKDYTPPEFLIDAVDLHFDLDQAATRVHSRLAFRRNPVAARQGGPLELNGEHLRLESVKLDGRSLSAAEYTKTPELLILPAVPDAFVLEVVTHIDPSANTAYEGLYLSAGMLCTQCEAHGFRRITYFLDRPDVMAPYSVTLAAERAQFPVLLSNGNRVDGGCTEDGRHWVRWVDPHRKPCYLFALVAGDLRCVEDRYTTVSGREVRLQIYVEERDLDKCAHAMRSLRNAMRWDEQHYGREYDLDLYMIVAVSHFNMGAMENKGLNIFNTAYVLARPDTATDDDYEHIEGVIGHEYFHNWTGNRITCRDWFQLSLKEGLTVFRDQEFSADMGSRAVKRIQDVAMLRERQFAEDAGPLAHPVRPDAYIEINNFYTLTVYEKGAEVIRMQRTLLGQEGFRKGMDLYFQRHDGQAVTCDDFVRCMEDANGVDLGQFRLWYSQAGTPRLTVRTAWDARAGSCTLELRQSCPPTPGQPVKRPMHIPVAVGLVGPDGRDLPLTLEGESQPGPTTRVLELREAEQRFVFTGLGQPPVLSVLRGFSAPVRLEYPRSLHDLAFLLRHDSDPVSRWDAGQELACRIILEMLSARCAGQQFCIDRPVSLLLEAYDQLLAMDWDDPAFLAALLQLPSEDYLADRMAVVDVDGIHAARQWLRQTLAREHAEAFALRYQQLQALERGDSERPAIARRRLKNVCLDYLAERETPETHALCLAQFQKAQTMTDQYSALQCIVNTLHPERDACLEAFYERWRDEALVVDKWFRVQATCRLAGTLDRVRRLTGHPAFDLATPNRVRALVGAFANGNPVHFHRADGGGYAYLAEQVMALDALNPQVASRLLQPLTRWQRQDAGRQALMRAQLQRIAGQPDVSRDVYEVVSKSLTAG